MLKQNLGSHIFNHLLPELSVLPDLQQTKIQIRCTKGRPLNAVIWTWSLAIWVAPCESGVLDIRCQRVKTDSNKATPVTRWPAGKDTDFYKQSTEDLNPWQYKCLNCGRDYVEKQWDVHTKKNMNSSYYSWEYRIQNMCNVNFLSKAMFTACYKHAPTPVWLETAYDQTCNTHWFCSPGLTKWSYGCY